MQQSKPKHWLPWIWLCSLWACSMLAYAENDEHKPYALPTYKGDKPSIHAKEQPDSAPVLPPTRELFERALDCWPARSYMRAEVSVEGRLNDSSSTLFDGSQTVNSGRTSAALVARIPLYSASELDRERQREFDRRTKAADAVGDLVGALADLHRIKRELDINRALERRSQERVRIGVAETSEQVRYFEKVADLEAALVKQNAQIQKARLTLLGLCSRETANQVDQYVQRFIKEP